MMEESPLPPVKPAFAEAFRFWLKLGFISFGGPAGQIAIMHVELVEKKRWISEARFLHALNFCMLLPGPEAQQLSIYIGWLLHRTWGGVVAGALFVLPSVFILWLLSYIYMAYGQVPWIAAAFYGLQPAVMAIVAAAVLRIGSKALKNAGLWAIALAAFVGIFFFKIHFVLIILGAGLIGIIGGKFLPAWFAGASPHSPSDNPGFQVRRYSSRHRTIRVLAIGMALWWTPILVAGAWLGWDGILFREGVFFSKAALVTFGGAYAVLPFVAQQAVSAYGWLSPAQMMAGLALAETTPGPLIMVLQFVGFVGAWQNPGALNPLGAATLGALITSWATFLPSFLFVLLGAPYMERLRELSSLSAALSAITAAVVGVILNLAVWFGLQALFPGGNHVDWFAVMASLAFFSAIQGLKMNVIAVVAAGGMLGVLYHLVF